MRKSCRITIAFYITIIINYIFYEQSVEFIDHDFLFGLNKLCASVFSVRNAWLPLPSKYYSTIMGQCWQIDNRPGEAYPAAFDGADTGTERQKSNCVKSRRKVHQLMCINIGAYTTCAICKF